MDNRRLILFLIFSFSLVMLWDAWQHHNQPPPAPSVAATTPQPSAPLTAPGAAAAAAPGVAPAVPATPEREPPADPARACSAVRSRFPPLRRGLSFAFPSAPANLRGIA